MRIARKAETDRSWPTLSPDPVIQWCLEEALTLRLLHDRDRTIRKRDAVRSAQEQAQAQLARAAG